MFLLGRWAWLGRLLAGLALCGFAADRLATGRPGPAVIVAGLGGLVILVAQAIRGRRTRRGGSGVAR